MLTHITLEQFKKRDAIIAELQYQVGDIVSDLVKEHNGLMDYEKARDYYHEQAAQNIDAWDSLTWDIDELEQELDRTPFDMDPETGCAGPAYDWIFQRLEDAKEDAEDWSLVFDDTFEDFWGGLEDAIYGVGG